MPTTYAAYDHVKKVGDLEPAIEATLEDENGDPIDLSNADHVDFHMGDPRKDTAKIDAQASIDGDPANGEVSYSWSSGDTDAAGDFEAEFQVTWSDGDTETFPADGYLDVKFLEPVA